MKKEGIQLGETELQEILKILPEPIFYAFGYGSGIFTQDIELDLEPGVPMVDLIISVPDSRQWHESNLSINGAHYAFFPRLLGSFFVEQVGSKGAGVFFNPMVKVDHPSGGRRLVKYGIICNETLQNDLRRWDSIYVAGRMQKPIVNLRISDEIKYLQQEYNLKYAMSTALLLMSGDFIRNQSDDNTCTVHYSKLFETIARISYLGDPRVMFGAEDPLKVKKLVSSPGQFNRFKSLYDCQFQRFESLGILSRCDQNCSSFEIDVFDPSTRYVLFEHLPTKLQQENKLFFKPSIESENFCKRKINMGSKSLKNSISKIVAPQARIQSLKGLVSAGFNKSAIYIASKLSKGCLNGMAKFK